MTTEQLGGIQLIRKLGEGDRAEVHLVRLRDRVGEAGALKHYRSHVDPRSISAEIEALCRAQGPHVVPLVDLTTMPDGVPALVLDRLGRGSLTDLLRNRSQLAAGEAITILAPLAQAIARVHRSGAVHAGIRPDAVLFTGAGAPVLACFGHAFPIGRDLPPARLSAEPGVALDVSGFAALARTVLAHVDDAGMRGLSDFARPGPALESHDWLDRFGDRLFDSGVACAVELSGTVGLDLVRTTEAIPMRAHFPAAHPIAEVQVAPASPDQSGVIGAGIRGVVGTFSDQIPDAVRETLTRVVAAVRAVRARWWGALGLVGVLIVVALVLIPARRSAPQPSPSPSFAATTAGASASEPPEVASDNPTGALVALLRARQGCIAQLSVLCLDSVDQSPSAALVADQALVRSLQSGAGAHTPWKIDESRLTVVERLGNSALVAIADPAETEPASVLLMKGEAGWRIRDYLDR